MMINKIQEILTNDSIHNSLDSEILTSEKKFKETLNKNQLESYLKLEGLVCNQINHDEQLIYKTILYSGAG